MVADTQEHAFQAETKHLLNLVIHSLYTNREIFLRELISNSSDALDRLRFETLTNSALLPSDHKFEIRLQTDPELRTLTISDSGIGMNRQEVITNIGTIAWSGTREARERLDGAPSSESMSSLIGQFGVGFYSAFMVAERVVLITRRAGEAEATRWESNGAGSYTIADAEKQSVGTSITLYLRPPDSDAGIEDFTDTWKITQLVKAYSDYIAYPIVVKDTHEEFERDALGNEIPTSKRVTVVHDKIVNSMKPLWTRLQQEVSEEEYKDFYKHIAHDWEEPLAFYTFRAEGRYEYQALLFIPSKAPQDLYYHAPDVGLRLCAKRVMVMEKCKSLLPSYLRFLRGVVDSSDVPLNISRQQLQQDRHTIQIRKWLTKKVLDVLEEMRANDPAKYLRLWNEFGRAIKEGVGEDFANKDRLLGLLLFESSHDPSSLTSLKEYVERMKPEQAEIYYLTADSRATAENSPHIEAIKERGCEVLFLVDPVDELLLQYLSEFDGKRLKSAGKGVIKLGEEEKEQCEASAKDFETHSPGFLESLQKRLDAHVKNVRLTTRLTKSAACLVVEEYDYSPRMERQLLKGKGGGMKQRRVLELNPTHSLVTRMRARFQQNADDPLLDDAAQVLFGLALIAEGSEIADPVRFNESTAKFLERAV